MNLLDRPMRQLTALLAMISALLFVGSAFVRADTVGHGVSDSNTADAASSLTVTLRVPHNNDLGIEWVALTSATNSVSSISGASATWSKLTSLRAGNVTLECWTATIATANTSPGYTITINLANATGGTAACSESYEDSVTGHTPVIEANNFTTQSSANPFTGSVTTASVGAIVVMFGSSGSSGQTFNTAGTGYTIGVNPAHFGPNTVCAGTEYANSNVVTPGSVSPTYSLSASASGETLTVSIRPQSATGSTNHWLGLLGVGT